MSLSELCCMRQIQQKLTTIPEFQCTECNEMLNQSGGSMLTGLHRKLFVEWTRKTKSIFFFISKIFSHSLKAWVNKKWQHVLDRPYFFILLKCLAVVRYHQIREFIDQTFRASRTVSSLTSLVAFAFRKAGIIFFCS